MKIMNLHSRSKRGFTLVELLITIVVIAILATITIVSYGGIQQRARESRVVLQLTQLRKNMEYYRIENGKWPFDEDGIRACAAGTLIGDTRTVAHRTKRTRWILLGFS